MENIVRVYFLSQDNPLVSVQTLLIGLLFATSVAAHSPVLNDARHELTLEDPYPVTHPENSQAFYFELVRKPQWFRIESDRNFRFYVGILQPKIDGCARVNFSFEVYTDDLVPADGRDGPAHTWSPFFEPVGRDWYWKGPEIGENSRSDRIYRAGTYYIKVFNQANLGRYVLAIGDREWFGLGTLLSLPKTMRWMDEVFWSAEGCGDP